MSDQRKNRNWKGKNRNWKTEEPSKKHQRDEYDSSEQCDILNAFEQYRNQLDAKHDKTERLIKLSRDLTIESKRIIFLLHSSTKIECDSPTLSEAKTRLMNLCSGVLYKISQELEGEDLYQFVRAYSPGIQEFVEATTFYQYLSSEELFGWEPLQVQLTYDIRSEDKVVEKDINEKLHEVTSEMDKSNIVEHLDESGENFKSSDIIMLDSSNSLNLFTSRKLKVYLSLTDYILGVQDLTGELMRHSINSLSTGDTVVMFKTCDFVRKLYSGMALFTRVQSKEFGKKLYVLKQSLMKIENACYLVNLRGSEIPKHMLASVVTEDQIQIDDNEDEGFC